MKWKSAIGLKVKILMIQYKNIKPEKHASGNREIIIKFCICFIILASLALWPVTAAAAGNSSGDSAQDTNASVSSAITEADSLYQGGELHAFYPSNAVYSEQIQKYIDAVDSLSFAWSRIDAADPGNLNVVKGKNGNSGFYYPNDYLLPVKYAKNKGKPIQLNIYNGLKHFRLLILIRQ
jgi:internalin A